MKKTFKISKEIKDQILERVKEGSSSVPKIAEEHGISPNTILISGIVILPILNTEENLYI